MLHNISTFSINTTMYLLLQSKDYILQEGTE